MTDTAFVTSEIGESASMFNLKIPEFEFHKSLAQQLSESLDTVQSRFDEKWVSESVKVYQEA